MITFLTGLESEYKTGRFVDLIKESANAGRRVTVIVPEQQAVVWERRLARALSPSSSLALDVVSFTRLANLAERRFGGLSYSLADRGERFLLMWRAISAVAPMLRVYGDRRDPGSLVVSMQEVLGELERSGVSAEALAEGADLLEAEEGHRALADRMRDVALIYSEYKASFADRFDDPSDECEKLLEILKEHDLFGGGDVFVDSFYSLTAVESAIVREIFSQADNVTMTFACPAKKSENAPHLDHIRKFFLRMRSVCDARIEEIAPPEEPDERFARERRAICDHLWDFTAGPVEATPGEPYARIVRCADRYDEAEYAVARVNELVRRGARCSDIAVIARSTEPYAGIIDAAFADAGIPLSLSARFALASSPVVTLALALVRAVRFGRDDIVSALGTGLTLLTDAETESLSRYTQVWNIDSRAAWDVAEWTMNPDGFAERLSPRAERELCEANSAKAKIEDILSPLCDAFSGEPTVADACAALWRSLDAAGAYAKLGERAAALEALGFRDAANFMRGSFGELVGCLDSLVTVLGGEPTDAVGFSSMLRRLIGVHSVGVIPAGIDEVTFGAADRLRVDRVSHVIILGAFDGEFPRTPTESPIFTDTDRVLMEGAGVVLSDDAEARASAELFRFWRAASLGERSLDVVVPDAADGAKCEPSSGARRVAALIKDIETFTFSPDDAEAALWSRKDAALFASADGAGGGADASADPTDSRAFRGDPSVAAALAALGVTGRERDAAPAWDRVSPALAERVFGKNITVSQSRLESFISCPFRCYGRYVLDLDDRAENRIRPVDVGNLMHDVLEKYFTSGDIRRLSDDESAALVDRLTGDYVRRVFGDSPTPRVKYIARRVSNDLLFISKLLRREFAVSRFEPFAAEQPIGEGEGAIPPPVIDLGGGRTVSLRGVIDRLDVCRIDGETYVRVVDYKTGAKKLSDRDLALGLNTQLFLYLFAVCACPPGPFRDRLTAGTGEIVPAGAMYFSAKPGAATSPHPVDGDEAFECAKESVTLSGRFTSDERVLRAMDPELSGEFIPVKALRGGGFSKNALDAAQFDELRVRIEHTVASVAGEMLDGVSDALPLARGSSLPCEHCALMPVCLNVGGKCRREREEAR